MKRLFAGVLAFLILITLWGCTPENPNPGETTAAPTEELLTGWQVIDGEIYCFTDTGEPVTGWLSEFEAGESVRYYFHDNGKLATHWQEIGGKRYYFSANGAMTTGWLELEDGTYYFGMDGALFTGLLNIQGKGYYFGEDGRRYSGWLEQEGQTYYFGSEGIMAVGQVEIEGQTHHFSPHGVKILLVNPWNSLPADYTVELVEVTYRDRLETTCAEALQRMLADCEASGYDPMIVSAYRTQEEQDFLFQRKLNGLLASGWNPEKARTEAAKSVAIPGTSEHQLGLAVDIIDSNYGYLDDYQAQMPTQKWLMEHCHEYGFILRYPTGTTEITGIIFEPWHYRYVGMDIAREITERGITLEEYLGVV
jgi:LAS superfamily LD-carboxypeptidase LdcB/YHS domain-containing protein